MLKTSNLSVSYGPIRALRDISLTVSEGECVAVVGANGAGKSTLLNAVSGLLKASSGQIEFHGGVITKLPPWRIARLGLLQVPEGRQILGPLSVLENLQLGAIAAHSRQTKSALERVFDLFPVLAERRAQAGGALSGGQQQMLAIGRALMGWPKLLLLDEPSLGLAPKVVAQVFGALGRLRADGLTLLLVEQNARIAFAVSDRAYVLEQGRVGTSGPSGQLAKDPRIIEHYLGVPTSTQPVAIHQEREETS